MGTLRTSDEECGGFRERWGEGGESVFVRLKERGFEIPDGSASCELKDATDHMDDSLRKRRELPEPKFEASLRRRLH